MGFKSTAHPVVRVVEIFRFRLGKRAVNDVGSAPDIILQSQLDIVPVQVDNRVNEIVLLSQGVDPSL